jgi:O-antigen/teichoic acid export membrane protein
VLGTWWFVPHYLAGHSSGVTVGWLRAFLVVNLAVVPVMTVIDLLMMQGKTVAYSTWRSVGLVLNTVAVVGLAIAGELTLRNALAASMVTTVVWYAAVIVAHRAWPGRGFRLDVMKLQLHYGSRVAFGSFSALMISRLDMFLLVGIVASSQLGFYVVAVTAAAMTGTLAEAAGTTLFPRLMHTRGTSTYGNVFREGVLWILVTSCVASAATALVAPVGLPLLFGDAFRPSVHLVWILLPGMIAANLAWVFGTRLCAEGRPGAQSWGLFWAAVVTVIGLALFAGPYGITGAAVVTSVSQGAFLVYEAGAVVRHSRRTPTPTRI